MSLCHCHAHWYILVLQKNTDGSLPGSGKDAENLPRHARSRRSSRWHWNFCQLLCFSHAYYKRSVLTIRQNGFTVNPLLEVQVGSARNGLTGGILVDNARAKASMVEKSTSDEDTET